jgi:hypothetical protein
MLIDALPSLQETVRSTGPQLSPLAQETLTSYVTWQSSPLSIRDFSVIVIVQEEGHVSPHPPVTERLHEFADDALTFSISTRIATENRFRSGFLLYISLAPLRE